MTDATGRPTALLFPGQGSQAEGMRDDVLRAFPQLHALACELVGEDPFERADESTRFAQPAIFCASIAAWRSLETDAPIVAAAGHSLGELAALTAAGVFEPEEALRAVVVRGEAMAQAGARSGSMLAIMGGDLRDARRIADRTGLTVANDNAPGQVVLSGSHGRLKAAEEMAYELHLRAAPLKVAGAFHSPAVAAAAAPFARVLATVAVRPPAFPVYSGASAKPFADVRAELVAALTAPVRWRETVLALLEHAGAEDFCEPGPGKVLSRLVKRIVPRKELAHAR